MFLNIGSVVFDDKGNEYILEDKLGQGGFGYVYKAKRKEDNCIFAIKVSLPSFNSEDDKISFQNEITTALKVQGENVIKYEYVHNGDEFENLPPYIIMEYAEGGTLNSILKDEMDDYYDNDTLTTYFLQLANGMKSVNNILVHRDIKPDNILICNGTFKITDFGLAKIASERTRTMTFKGSGTPPYMSPEAWDYSKKNTIQMDIYSMGIIFYQLATNTYPYQIEGNTLEDLKNMHLYSTATSPERVNRSLSPALASLINKMIEKPTDKRFNTWNEIIECLEKQSLKSSKHSSLINKAISARNQEIETQKKQESLKLQKQQEEELFKKKILFKFKDAIVNPLEEFIEGFNDQFADEPINGFFSDKYTNTNCFSYEIRISDKRFVKISMNYCIDCSESEEECDSYDYWYPQTDYNNRNDKLHYKGKDIWAFGTIKNHNDLGFNIILVDNDELYGKWFIINNKNSGYSLITGQIKKEPFYWSLEEIQEVLDSNAYPYISEINEYNIHDFLSQIEKIAFEC